MKKTIEEKELLFREVNGICLPPEGVRALQREFANAKRVARLLQDKFNIGDVVRLTRDAFIGMPKGSVHTITDKEGAYATIIFDDKEYYLQYDWIEICH